MRPWKLALPVALVIAVVAAISAGATQAGSTMKNPKVSSPTFTEATAFDVSKPLSVLAREATPPAGPNVDEDEDGPATDNGFTGDGAVQNSTPASPTIAGPLVNFDGISNQDNFNLFGFRVNPPDPVGDVGPNNYVEMANLAFAVYDKLGNMLLGPVDTGTLWDGFAVTDCTDPSGDPVVLYDQTTDRWLLSQFTTRGPVYYDCVAVSQTGDPTGAYYRYAFKTQSDPELPGGSFFPDYPKYGVWTDSYVLTTRDFGDVSGYGISVYALEKNKMVDGLAKARAVQFFIDGNIAENLPLVGDGLLPADIDGKQKPKTDTAIPIVGTQDDGGGYGATFDAVNVWDLSVKWRSTPTASLTLNTQLPVAPFDSVFPCAPTSRDCLAQPGITNPAQYLDILSYRQRPTYRLAYRNFKGYESLVTNQSVEARPGVAGARWYEIRRAADGSYSLFQQGTFAPNDGVNRWMGSIAQDKKGNAAVGYSVVNGVDVYPGIRYTGRLAGDALGTMGNVGEGTIINGSGVQRTTNSRWGDYTSMNIDPVDDCTFWYVNEYYTLAGQNSSTAGWQTRIASFKLPGCS
jgi:hypothetical protein